MITKKIINLNPKNLQSRLTVMVIFLTLVILTIISIFLYKNFYQTITQTKDILILREKVAPYMVEMEKFNLIIDRLAKKTLPKKLDNIISPFH